MFYCFPDTKKVFGSNLCSRLIIGTTIITVLYTHLALKKIISEVDHIIYSCWNNEANIKFANIKHQQY